MLRGDAGFDGAQFTGNALLLTSFNTIVLAIAQDSSSPVKLLDIIQTFFCWPSFWVGTLIAFAFWLFRHIERILGTTVLCGYMIYALILYVPLFLLSISLYSYSSHPPFLLFIPFSMFVFTLWKVPSTQILGVITDKLLTCTVFGAIIGLCFPFGFFSLATAIVSHILWSYDTFKFSCILSKIFGRSNSIVAENPLPIVTPTQSDDAVQNVQNIVSMGFTEAEARNALQANGNRLQDAVSSLLGRH